MLPALSFEQLSSKVEVYDFIEILIKADKPISNNPFREVNIVGSFEKDGDDTKYQVEGFCDSEDGSLFRIRFMPQQAGSYHYTISYWQENLQKTQTGSFLAVDAHRSGLVQVDPKYPWHFIWKGTGEHYFLNGTTAFLLMGWNDEKVIFDSLSRLDDLNVNRVRVLLDGRTDHFWTEPIKPNDSFVPQLNPWLAKRPYDLANPGFDFSRFNVAYWQKFERMLKYARAKDQIISVILDWNDTSVHADDSFWFRLNKLLKSFRLGWQDASLDQGATYWQRFKRMLKAVFMGWKDAALRPLPGSDDERKYIRYAMARLGAFSNITWDLGDDLDRYRDDAWTHDTGIFLTGLDPYHHLATSHPVDNQHQDRASTWFGMTSFQQWDRPLHGWMVEQRKVQAATGRIIPQVNEEYGYEDHYPDWAPYKSPAASSDANRRVAWEIAMAGAYQTTGETAKRGTGSKPNTGGGWVNGRGDNSMTMLKGYAHLVHFFTGFEWWKTNPHDELVNNGAFCLAEPGHNYVVYLPKGGNVTVKLIEGQYSVKWFNPRTGVYSKYQVVKGPTWTSNKVPEAEDWAFLITSL